MTTISGRMTTPVSSPTGRNFLSEDAPIIAAGRRRDGVGDTSQFLENSLNVRPNTPRHFIKLIFETLNRSVVFNLFLAF